MSCKTLLYLSYLLHKQRGSRWRSVPSRPGRGGGVPSPVLPDAFSLPVSQKSPLQFLQMMPVSSDNDSWTNTSEASYLAEVTGREPFDVAAFPRFTFILVSLAEFSVPSWLMWGNGPTGERPAFLKRLKSWNSTLERRGVQKQGAQW